MDFTTCLREQLRLHPSMQPRDVIKLCYQAARGAEHLLSDTTRARAYFDQEYAVTPADDALPLFESISEKVARVNIAAWKTANLPAEWLFRMFVHTARVPMGGETLLKLFRDGSFPVCTVEDAPFVPFRGVHLYLPAPDQINFTKRLPRGAYSTR